MENKNKNTALGGAGAEANATPEQTNMPALTASTIRYMAEVEGWLAAHPEWRSPRGGAWEIIKATAGRRGQLPYRVAYLYLGILWNASKAFRYMLKSRGVRWR